MRLDQVANHETDMAHTAMDAAHSAGLPGAYDNISKRVLDFKILLTP
jgi:hypothetical protein